MTWQKMSLFNMPPEPLSIESLGSVVVVYPNALGIPETLWPGDDHTWFSDGRGAMSEGELCDYYTHWCVLEAPGGNP